MIDNVEMHEYNIFQNFYIIGIHKSEHRKFPYNITNEVLSKYPKTKLPYITIPHEIIINFVFPNGNSISDKEPSSEFFMFSLENISTQTTIHHPKIYFGCFLFPELLLNVPNTPQSSSSSSSIPVAKYAHKAIVLSSFYPFYQEMQLILSKLYYEINHAQMHISLKRIVTSLLCDLPTPPNSFIIEYIFLNANKVIFKQPAINHLPNYSIDLRPLVSCLTPENIIKIIKCLLLELPIVVFGEDKYELSCLIEGLVSLLFPFKYPHTVVSVLPCVYYSLMQNVDCFIIGINERFREDWFEMKGVDLRGKNIVMVALRYGRNDETMFFQKRMNDGQRLISLSQFPPMMNEGHGDNTNGYTATTINGTIGSNSTITITNTNDKTNNTTNLLNASNISMSSSGSSYSLYGIGSYVGSVMGSVMGMVGCSGSKCRNRHCNTSSASLHSGYNSKEDIFNDVPLPKHYCEKIMMKIQEAFYDNNKGDKLKQWTENSNEELREIIFYLFIALFVNYQQYLIIDEKTIIDLYPKIKDSTHVINTLFKLDDFLAAATANDLQFFNIFLHTQVWSDFLIRKFYPCTKEDKFLILFFDEHIFRKKNRTVKTFSKYKTPFIETNYSVTKKTIIAPRDKPNEEVNEENIKLEGVNLFDAFENNIGKTVQSHAEFFENYGIIGYNINMAMKIQVDMEQYIIKLWFKIFAMTFWGINAKEKWFRFNQMITCLSNYWHMTRYIDEEIQHDLLTTIITYGDMQMSSILFSFLPSSSFLIYVLIHEKFIDNTRPYNQYNYSKERNFNIITTSSSSNVLNTSIMPQSFSKKIEFLTKFQCEKCSNEYDLRQYTLSLNTKEIKTDSIYFTCQKCPNRFPATIRIKSSNDNSSSVSVSLLTPSYVFNRLKRSYKITFERFYAKNKDLFWNMVWYFDIKGLPYDCLFPYMSHMTSFKYDNASLKQSNQTSFSLIKENIVYEDTLMKGVNEIFFDHRSHSLAKLGESISFQAANEARKRSVCLASSSFFLNRTQSNKSPQIFHLLKGTK